MVCKWSLYYLYLSNCTLALFYPIDDLFVLYNSPPNFILVEHNCIGAQPFTSLSNDTTPLYPIKSRSEIDSFYFVQSQLPVSPGFAITDFKSQRRSVNRAVVGLHRLLFIARCDRGCLVFTSIY